MSASYMKKIYDRIRSYEEDIPFTDRPAVKKLDALCRRLERENEHPENVFHRAFVSVGWSLRRAMDAVHGQLQGVEKNG